MKINEQGLITEEITLKLILCCVCNFPFAVQDEIKNAWRQSGKSFFCPSCGQSQSYKETEVQRLKRDLQLAIQNEAWYKERFETEKLSSRSQRGVSTRLRKQLQRVANGVCPCCNRHFSNLERHIGTKHPGYSCHKRQ